MASKKIFLQYSIVKTILLYCITVMTEVKFIMESIDNISNYIIDNLPQYRDYLKINTTFIFERTNPILKVLPHYNLLFCGDLENDKFNTEKRIKISLMDLKKLKAELLDINQELNSAVDFFFCTISIIPETYKQKAETAKKDIDISLEMINLLTSFIVNKLIPNRKIKC